MISELISLGDCESFLWGEHQPVSDSQGPTTCPFFFRIKKEWWDQIPNPAHSPLVAVVIQDSQVGKGVGEDALGRVYRETHVKTRGVLGISLDFAGCTWAVRKISG